jgi:hypothetical protein
MLQIKLEKLNSLYIIIICLVISYTASAQSNFYKIGIGGGAGLTQSFTDVSKHGIASSIYGVADYYFTPFISVGLEGQIGQITGGDINTDIANREFINTYKSATLNAKVFLGSLIDYSYSRPGNLLRGLYLGSGLGVIKNVFKPENIVRYQPGTNYLFPGEDNSYNILIPINLGLNIYFADGNGDYRYVVNFNFQSSITLGEGLDGYNDSPITFENGSPDIYNYMSVGLRYHFGQVGLSKKTFRKQ